MRKEICIKQIELSNGIVQMELFCICSNQNRTPTLGLKKLDPERGSKQGELAGTCTCLEVHPASQKVIAKFVKVSSKVGVMEVDQISSRPLLHFLFAAKIHKFEFS